jgi:hypothetical protein
LADSWMAAVFWLADWLPELGLRCLTEITYQDSTSGAYIYTYVLICIHTNKFSEKWRGCGLSHTSTYKHKN